MKKLMIAAAIVCAAAMTQAAQYTWSCSKGGNIYVMNSTDQLNQQNAYLFLATDAESVYNAWNNGSKSVAEISGLLDTSKTTSAGIVQSKSDAPISLDVAALNAIIATEVTIDGTKYLFISGAASKGSVTPGSANVGFVSDQMAASKGAATKWTEGGYAGAGWYSAAAVPEPTSGFLLLLGVAGLALRRRRA